MFDSFANSRRFAIEDTIINDKSHLPSIDDIIGHTQVTIIRLLTLKPFLIWQVLLAIKMRA